MTHVRLIQSILINNAYSLYHDVYKELYGDLLLVKQRLRKVTKKWIYKLQATYFRCLFLK